MPEVKEQTENLFDSAPDNPIEEPVEEPEYGVEDQLNRPIEETEESETKEVEEKPKEETVEEKSARYHQSRADKAIAELEKVKKELEEKQTTPEPNKPAEELVMPEEPVMPNDYDATDAVTDKSSTSYKYEQANKKYLKELALYNTKQVSKLIEERNAEKQIRQQNEKFAATKSYFKSEYIKLGLDEKEAEETFNMVNNPEYNTPENHIAFTRSVLGKSAPKPKNFKTKEGVLPPGVESGGEDKPLDDAESYANSLGGTNAKNLFETKK